MASTSLTNPATAFSEAARFGEIRNRILFLIGALVVYRIGTFIPVPGVNPAEVARFFADRSNTILGIVNLFSGGAPGTGSGLQCVQSHGFQAPFSTRSR